MRFLVELFCFVIVLAFGWVVRFTAYAFGLVVRFLVEMFFVIVSA